MVFNLPHWSLGIEKSDLEMLKLEYRQSKFPTEMALLDELARQSEWASKQRALAYGFKSKLFAPAMTEAGKRSRAAVAAVT